MGRSALRVAVGAVVLAVAAAGLRADEPGKAVPVLQKWDGVVKDEALRKSSPMTGYVANEKAFAKLWKDWRPDEKEPKVDFEKEIVLVGVASGPNRVTLQPFLNDKGDLTVHSRSTLIGGAGFGYGMVTVKREGIQTIKGKPIVNE